MPTTDQKFPINSTVYLVESGFKGIVLEATPAKYSRWVYTVNVRDLGDLYVVHRREELLVAERSQCENHGV